MNSTAKVVKVRIKVIRNFGKNGQIIATYDYESFSYMKRDLSIKIYQDGYISQLFIEDQAIDVFFEAIEELKGKVDKYGQKNNTLFG